MDEEKFSYPIDIDNNFISIESEYFLELLDNLVNSHPKVIYLYDILALGQIIYNADWRNMVKFMEDRVYNFYEEGLKIEWFNSELFYNLTLTLHALLELQAIRTGNEFKVPVPENFPSKFEVKYSINKAIYRLKLYRFLADYRYLIENNELFKPSYKAKLLIYLVKCDYDKIFNQTKELLERFKNIIDEEEYYSYQVQIDKLMC